MINLFIKKILKNLSIDDIFYYAKENNINLTNKEADIIYNYIKTNYNTILYDFDKTNSDIDKYLNNNDIKKLYELYYNKYKNYL